MLMEPHANNANLFDSYSEEVLADCLARP